MPPIKVMQGLLALGDVLPLPTSSTFEGWVRQQEQCMYSLLGLVVGQDDVFPLLALSHSAVTLWAASRAHSWTEALRQRWLSAGVGQNSACSRIRAGAEPTGPWQQWQERPNVGNGFIENL